MNRLPHDVRADVETLWAYHDMGHELRRCDVGIGLGSHDVGVAIHTAELYHRGMFPRIVFTGANAPTTVERFPRGEAVHYREHAIARGVPAEVISIESRATNTSQNLTNSRKVLADAGLQPAIGDVDRVITMLVGDTQRITEYARRGFAVEQDMPNEVDAAYRRLVAAGYTNRLI